MEGEAGGGERLEGDEDVGEPLAAKTGGRKPLVAEADGGNGGTCNPLEAEAFGEKSFEADTDGGGQVLFPRVERLIKEEEVEHCFLRGGRISARLPMSFVLLTVHLEP